MLLTLAIYNFCLFLFLYEVDLHPVEINNNIIILIVKNLLMVISYDEVLTAKLCGTKTLALGFNLLVLCDIKDAMLDFFLEINQ